MAQNYNQQDNNINVNIDANNNVSGYNQNAPPTQQNLVGLEVYNKPVEANMGDGTQNAPL